MKFIKQTTLFFVSTLILFSSCSKDENSSEIDNKSPEIVFNEPSLDLYGIEDTVPLKLHIEDGHELHSVFIQITNQANTDTISMKWDHLHKSHFMIDTFFVAYLDTTVMDMCNYYIKVEASDAEGNIEEGNKSVHIMEGTMDDHSGMNDDMDDHGDHSEM
jgi:hypothetical protein